MVVFFAQFAQFGIGTRAYSVTPVQWDPGDREQNSTSLNFEIHRILLKLF